MYAGALGDNAVERYAMFLTSLELIADINERRLALTPWTTSEDGIHNTALEQVTVILRYFLGAGSVLLAKILVEMLPRELSFIDQPEQRAKDYLHYRQFFIIQDSLDRVVECQSLEVSIMNRNTRAAWLIDQAYDTVVKLLTSDWM
ncbi:hypothetical protein DEU56DRAFT_820537, partial [Suillus clintonianus]|uniref:uncharacterized protein n=1 Tax=Suillus clintonianus TaxID=1904413 RepID=UPI001B85B857